MYILSLHQGKAKRHPLKVINEIFWLTPIPKPYFFTFRLDTDFTSNVLKSSLMSS